MFLKRHSGFTLVELSVALVIIGLLLAAAMIPLSTQIDLRNDALTRRTLDQIKEALIGYAQIYGRLPCPANGAIASGSSNAGVEVTSGSPAHCARSFGVVPWATLGVPETDAWGRRFSYAVAPAFADDYSMLTWSTSRLTSPPSYADQNPTCAPNPTPSPPASFALCTLGDIAIVNPTATNKVPTTAIAQGVAAVIISYGKNGYGAYQSNGQRISGSGGADELANLSGGLDSNTLTDLNLDFRSRVFYTRETTSQSSSCSDTTAGTPLCEFDDLLTWISPTTLAARMVSAGRLP